MGQAGADRPIVVMKRGNARRAKGVGHSRHSLGQGETGGTRLPCRRRQPSLSGTSRMRRESHVPRRVGPGNFTPSLSQIREVLNTSVASSPRRARNDLLPSMQLLSIALKDLRMPERQVRKLQEGHITEVANGITTLGFSVPVLVGKHNEAGTAQAVSDHREAARPMTFNAIDLPEQRPPLMRSAVTASRRLRPSAALQCADADAGAPLDAGPGYSPSRRLRVRARAIGARMSAFSGCSATSVEGGLAQGDASLTPVQAPKTASLLVRW